jgi:hypothetical protein
MSSTSVNADLPLDMKISCKMCNTIVLHIKIYATSSLFNQKNYIISADGYALIFFIISVAYKIKQILMGSSDASWWDVIHAKLLKSFNGY